MTHLGRSAGRFFLALLLGLVWSATSHLPANAGLQRWSVVKVDASGRPASAGATETYASNQRGFTVSLGCMQGGGHKISLHAPDDLAKDFAGPEIEPSLRVAKPGTDLFKGPIGKMTFNGERYEGALPAAVMDALQQQHRDGQLTVTEFLTRTIITVKLADLDRTLPELGC